MTRKIMTDVERDEIAEIERKTKELFEEAGRRLFGAAFTTKVPPLYHD